MFSAAIGDPRQFNEEEEATVEKPLSSVYKDMQEQRAIPPSESVLPVVANPADIEGDQEIQSMVEAVKNNGFDLRSHIGSVWQHDKSRDADLMRRYKAVGSSRKDQQLLRVNWLKGKIQTMVKQKYCKTTSERVETGALKGCNHVLKCCDVFSSSVSYSGGTEEGC